METMVHDNTETVNQPTYYLTRAQLEQALICAIDEQQEYVATRSLDAHSAVREAVGLVLEGLDADRKLNQLAGEPLMLQLAQPDPSATIAELMRQRDQARFEAHAARHSQPGRYAFHFRHAALSYVRKANPDLFNAAHAAAYDALNTQALGYEDVVAGLEAQVAALKVANEQADEALEAIVRWCEGLDYDHTDWLALLGTGHAALAALREAHAKAVQP